MLDYLLSLDTKLFIYLNGLGSESFDGLWLLITKQAYWTPLFLFLLHYIYKKKGAKQTLILLLFVAVLVTCTDQVCNLFKNGFHRLRPCNNLAINNFIRIVKTSNSFSFFSGHAANTMAVTTFLFMLFRKKQPYFRFLFLWPLFFAYSRIYLGLHYPLDIICGYICGFLFGYLFFRSYLLLQKRFFTIL